MNDVFAIPGEIVTCENGHNICEVAKELRRWETVTAADSFKNWTFEYTPKAGTPVPKCPTCGRRFIKSGAFVCIAGEWRPKPQEEAA